jgi:hypothetical protein
MSITSEQIAELEAALEKATKGEWEYRSHEFDDWGVIRSDTGAEATGFLVAISRAGCDADLDAHRAAKTDPYEPNGRFIALAHNLMPALIAAAKERDSAIAAGRKAAIEEAEEGEVRVVVSGLTGSGKSAIAGEIEIALRAIGVPVEWPDGAAEKNWSHADWQSALELYNPRVVIVERNVPRKQKDPTDG